MKLSQSVVKHNDFGLRSLVARRNLLRRTALCGVLSVSAVFGGHLTEAVAGPVGTKVTSGSVSVQRSGTHTEFTQTTNKAILTHKSFDIGRNESVNFAQPSKNALAVNKIVGSDLPTNIAGKLTANGNVWVINPSGVAISGTAQVNVNGLIATTASISDQDILSGRNSFAGAPDGSSVVNAGRIDAGDGSVVLVAPVVENTGTITTNGSDIALGAGSGFTVDFDGDGLTRFEVAAGNGVSLTNTGTLSAQGGAAYISAASADQVHTQVVSIGGKVEATRIEENGGVIVISGGESGVTEVSGDIDATQDLGDGGQIAITGNEVEITETARIDASGAANGGQIEIGGGYKGAAIQSEVVGRVSAPTSAPLPTSKRTTVRTGAVIAADAGAAGDGGEVIVWADQRTEFRGTISAKGGFLTGDGGFAEVSGKSVLLFAGGVDLSAVGGNVGTLLLDPENIVIAADGAEATTINLGDDGLDGDGTPGDGDGTSTIEAEFLNDSNVAVVLQASNDIIVDEVVDAEVDLTFEAGNNIVLNADVITTEALTLTADADTDGTGDIQVNAVEITLSAGDSLTLRVGGAVVDSALSDDDTPVAVGVDLNLIAGADLELPSILLDGGFLGDDVSTLSITATNQNITQTAGATIEVSGTTSVDAGNGDVDFGNAGNVFAGDADDGQFNATGAVLTLSASDDVVLGDISADDLIVTVTNADISQADDTSVIIAASTSLSAGTGAITLDSETNDFADANNGNDDQPDAAGDPVRQLDADGGSITIVDTDAIRVGNITQTDADGTLTLEIADSNNLIQVEGTAISIAGTGTIISDDVADDGNGGIAVLSDLTSEGDVLVQTARLEVDVDSGNGPALDLGGNTLTIENFQGDAVALQAGNNGGGFSLGEGEFEEIAAGAVIIDSNDENITIANFVLDGVATVGTLTLDAGDATATLINVQSSVANTDLFVTAGNVQVQNNITVTGQLDLTNGSDDEVTIGDDGGFDLTNNELARINTDTLAINADLDAAGNGAQIVLFDGATNLNAVDELDIDAVGRTVSFENNDSSIAGALTIDNAASVAFNVSVEVGGTTSLTADGDITQLAAAGLTAPTLTIDAGGNAVSLVGTNDIDTLNADDVSTLEFNDTDDVTIGAVTVDGDATITASDVDIATALDVGDNSVIFDNASGVGAVLGGNVDVDFTLTDADLGRISADELALISTDANEDVRIDGVTSLLADLSITAGTNNVSYDGASSGLGDLTVVSALNFAPVDDLATLSVGTNTISAVITGDATISGVTASTLDLELGDDVLFDGAGNTIADAVSIDAVDNAIILFDDGVFTDGGPSEIALANGAVLATETLTLTSNGAGITVNAGDLTGVTTTVLTNNDGDDAVAEAAGVTISGLQANTLDIDTGQGDVLFNTATTTINNDLTVSDSGSISQDANGLLTVIGTTDLTTDGAIALGQSNDFQDTVSVDAGDVVALTDANDVTLGAVTSGDLTVTSEGGSISTGNEIALTDASVTLTAATDLDLGGSITTTDDNDNTADDNIVLVSDSDADGVVNGDIVLNDGVAVSAAGDLTLNTNGGLLVDEGVDGTVIIQAGGNIVLPSTNFDAANVTLEVNSGGTITQQAGSILTVAGVVDLTSGDAITLTEANDFQNTVTLDADDNTVALTDANDVTIGDVTSGDLTVISNAGSVSLAGTIATGDLVATATAGSVDISGSITSGDLTATAGNGSVTTSADIELTDASVTLSATDDISLNGSIATTDTDDDTTNDNIVLISDSDIDGVIGGNIVLNEDIAVVAAGDLTLNTNGGFLIDGAADGTATLQAGRDIVLPSTNFDAVGVTLEVISGGNVSQQTGSTVTVAGNSNLQAGGTIVLAEAGNNFGLRTDLEGVTATIDDVDGFTLGDVSLSGNLTIDAGGTIQDTDDETIRVDGTTSLSATDGANDFFDIALDDPDHDFGGAVSAEGEDIALADTNALDLGTVTTNVDASPDATVETLDALNGADGSGGDLILTADGAITDSGTVTVADELAIAAAGQDVTLDSLVLTGTVDATADDLTLVEANGLILGNITLSGDLDASTNAGDIVDNAGDTVSVSGATSLDAAATITIDNGTHTFGNAGQNADIADRLVILGAASITEFSAASGLAFGTVAATDSANVLTTLETSSTDGITLTDSITLGDGSLNDLAVTSAGGITQTGGAITADTTTMAAADDVTQQGGSIVATTLVLESLDAVDAVDFTLDQPNNVVSLSTLGEIEDLVFTDVNGLELGDVSVTGLTVTTGLALTQAAATAVVATGDVSLSAGDPALTGAANAANGADIVLDNTGNDFGTVAASGGNIDLVDQNDLELSTITVANDVTIAATDTLTAADITSDGNVDLTAGDDLSIANLTAGGDVTLTATANDISVSGALTSGGRVDLLAGDDITATTIDAVRRVGATSGGILTFQSIDTSGGSIDLVADDNFQITPGALVPLDARGDITLTSANGSFLTGTEQSLQDGLRFRSRSGNITLDFGTAFFIEDTDFNEPFTLDAPNGLSQIRIDEGIFAIGSANFLVSALQTDFDPFANIFVINSANATLFTTTGNMAFVSDGALSVRIQNTSITPNQGAGVVIAGTPFVGGAFEDISLFGQFGTQSGQTAALAFRDAADIGLPGFVVDDDNTANGCIIGLPSDCQPIGSLVLTLEFEDGALLGVTFVDPAEDEDDPFSNRGDEEEWE